MDGVLCFCDVAARYFIIVRLLKDYRIELNLGALHFSRWLIFYFELGW